MGESMLKGFKGRDIEVQTMNTGSKRIALLYPGMNYGPDAPLNYYLSRLLLSEGFGICFFNFQWFRLPVPAETPKARIFDFIREEIRGTEDFVSSSFGDKETLLVAKSVGTLCVEALSAGFLQRTLGNHFLTPLPDPRSCTAASSRSHAYIGDRDSYIPPDLLLQAAADSLPERIHLFPGADHAFCHPEDPLAGPRLAGDLLKCFVTNFRGSQPGA